MCHHHRYRYERAPERVVTPAPPSGPVRVGDDDRERVAALLRDHATAGRLDSDELEERLGRAYAARYGSDLEAALEELPPRPVAAARARPHPHRGAPALPLAIAALIALAAITSAWWLLWLIWPIVIVLGPRRRHWRAPF
jgi:Domain of unknown function (DUF1707)